MRVRVDIQHSDKVHDAIDAVVEQFGAKHHAGAYNATDEDEDGYECIKFVDEAKAEDFEVALRAIAGVQEVRIYSKEDFVVPEEE